MKRLLVAAFSIALFSCDGGIPHSGTGGEDIVPNSIFYAPVAGSPNAIQENAEGYCGADGPVQANHDGYSGQGFVNTENVLGASVRWQVSVPRADRYDVRIRFANGASSARGGLLLSRVGRTEFAMQGTGGWSQWSTGTESISLESGSNRITLSAETTSGLPNIDSIEVVGGSGADCSGSVSNTIQSDLGNSASSTSDSSANGNAASANSSQGSTDLDRSLTIQEDRGFCSVDGLVESVHRGFLGAGYANTDNATGTRQW